MKVHLKHFAGRILIVLLMLKTVNRESLRIGQYENLKKDAIELYPFLRDVYEQNRAKLIEE